MRRAATLGLLLLAGCATPPPAAPPGAPTLASLAPLRVHVDREPTPAPLEAPALAAYREFLGVATDPVQRAEVERRIGDLEMDRADRLAAARGIAPDYRAAIAAYRARRAEFPHGARDDAVQYQLARAEDLDGDADAALATLTGLAHDHPDSVYADEANFRRGEMLFARADYAGAEPAYAAVLAGVRRHTLAADLPRAPLYERALYMDAWSQYKLDHLDVALAGFFELLDLKLGGLSPAAAEVEDPAAIQALGRADLELVDDTLRIVAIGLSQQAGPDGGGAAIASHLQGRLRRGYAFRVYRALADLYLHQGRHKDAGDTDAAFVRSDPLHAQAPHMQALAVQAYERGGLVALALQARRDDVRLFGADSELRRLRPTLWRQTQPQVRADLAELAHEAHARAQRDHAAADVDAAAHWYRELIAALPDAAAAQQQRFLLAELLYDARRYADAAQAYETVAYAAPATPHGADAGYTALLAYAAQPPTPALRRQAVASALEFARRYAGDPRCAAVLVQAATQLR
ncbi:MAG: hypothetical protein KGJ30_21050, partial [Burkholderiales bacterium]|nr:hypothetical protein [Burkholderiales bacterium]